MNVPHFAKATPSPGITAIVPTHKRPELMRRAVQSIVDQDYDGEIEIIVVFDACEVELPDIDLRSNQSIRGLPNHRSRGLAGARNTGITLAQHSFVAFLDDDDFWLQGKLVAQMAMFASRPKSILVGTAIMVDDGERTHERLVSGDTVERSELLLKHPAGLHSSGFVFRRDMLLGELGLVDEDLPRSYGEDYDMLLRTARLQPVSVVNRPLVNVTWAGQSYYFGKWAVYAEALQYLLHKHPDFADDPRAIGHIESQVAFALAASNQPRDARTWAARSLRHDWRQAKASIAYAVSLGLVTPDQVTRVARLFGKGI